MPRRDTHITAGLTVGFAWAYYHARNEQPADRAAEVLGGAVGGWVGALLPDLIDPPTTPQHRDIAHGFVLLLIVAFTSLEAERRECRNRAIACDRGGDETAELRRLIWRFVAGALAGVQAGYVSHLVLDGNTKAALPLLLRGF